jgi:hypothetical protein
VAFSIQIGIVFDAIGPNNPLAATTFAFLTAATNIPVTYMMVADGRAYSAAGIVGTFSADASISIAAWLVMGTLLSKLSSKAPGATVQPRELASAIDLEGDL